MKISHYVLFVVATLLLGCVDAFEPDVRSTVNILVIDGTINDLPEEQIILLSIAKADVKTGRFGQTPVRGAIVQVLVNGATLVTAAEKAPGEYVLPADFRGRVGARYRLQIALEDGQQYVSDEQTMPRPVPMSNLRAQFSTRAIDTTQYQGYRAGHNLLVDVPDPPGERNYYRWEWKDFERQYFCATCDQGMYSVYKPFIQPRTPPLLPVYASGTELLEDCFVPKVNQGPVFDPDLPFARGGTYWFDYQCRSECWEIIRSNNLIIFSDELTNGGVTSQFIAGAVPFFTRTPALAELRQLAITPEAYTYYKLVQDQTQNTGGVADTPPAAPIGNVRNVANPNRGIVGFFSAASATTQRIWLDRKDATVPPMGADAPQPPDIPNLPPLAQPNLPGLELFYALNKRMLLLEPRSPPFDLPFTLLGPSRPPTAVCRQSRSRTPLQPNGWRSF